MTDIIDQFVEFMKTHAVCKDLKGCYAQDITHTLMDVLHQEKHPYRGSFDIQGRDYNKFLVLYNSVIDKMPLSIVERHINTGKMVGPLIFDVDYCTLQKNRQYDTTLIKNMINLCNKYFMEYLDIHKNEIIAYIIEKKEPTFCANRNVYKDGFHIFYDIPLSYDQRKFLFDKITSEIEKQNIFELINTDTPVKDMIDKHMLMDTGFLMYGSAKKDRDSYYLTKIYNYDCEEKSVNEHQNQNLVNLFSLRKYTDDDAIEYK